MKLSHKREIDESMWNKFMAHHPARVLALAVCLGVFIGGSLPELGNMAVYYMSENAVAFNRGAHAFNGLFLAFGIGGVVVCGIALYRRFSCTDSSSSRMAGIKCRPKKEVKA